MALIGMTTWRAARIASVGAALVFMAACETSADQSATEAPAQTSAAAETVVETSAVVVSVDQETRRVVVNDEDGRQFSIIVDPNVPNLDQVEEGDVINIAYHSGVIANLVEPGSPPAQPKAAAGVARAPEGEKPIDVVGAAVSTRVTIVSFDPASNLISFAPPDGIVRSMIVREPEMQEFARTLKAGDEVDVTFVEAVAVSVVEPSL